MGTQPARLRLQIADYCREIEAYLCRKNDGHVIRVVGPSFDLVARWAAKGVPINVAYEGIDRYFERYYRKGPRRRPVKIDFCEPDVLDVFDEFSRDYTKRHQYKSRPGTVHMHSIEGGWPYRCNRVPIFCHVFLEFRIMPDQNMNEVPLEVERLLDLARRKSTGLEFDTEYFVTLPPCKDASDSIVARRIRAAHTSVMRQPPQEGVGLFFSDASHLQAYGIPVVNYGPSGRTVTGKENWDPEVGEHLSIEDLTNTAKVYTALILDVCSKTRAELGLPTLAAK